MVTQSERALRRIWPFGWGIKQQVKDTLSDEETGVGSDESSASDVESTQEPHHCRRCDDDSCERCSQAAEPSARRSEPLEKDADAMFTAAECMELGLSRELVTEFVHPLRRAPKLFRFTVRRSEDLMSYTLRTEAGEFLMAAEVDMEARRVAFTPYDASDEESSRLYNPDSPAFAMTFNDAATDWRLVQERCEACCFRAAPVCCACQGKQQVAVIRHSTKAIGEGVFRTLDVRLPGVEPDSRRTTWCSAASLGDLGATSPDGTPALGALRLVTREPSWNDDIGSLVLDFRGRSALSSAKNFQLTAPHEPTRLLCQYAKIGQHTFSLDFRFPLGVAQAFGIALSTLLWQ